MGENVQVLDAVIDGELVCLGRLVHLASRHVGINNAARQARRYPASIPRASVCWSARADNAEEEKQLVRSSTTYCLPVIAS
jgi:hypothetical protein